MCACARWMDGILGRLHFRIEPKNKKIKPWALNQLQNVLELFSHSMCVFVYDRRPLSVSPGQLIVVRCRRRRDADLIVNFCDFFIRRRHHFHQCSHSFCDSFISRFHFVSNSTIRISHLSFRCPRRSLSIGPPTIGPFNVGVPQKCYTYVVCVCECECDIISVVHSNIHQKSHHHGNVVAGVYCNCNTITNKQNDVHFDK